MGAVWTTDFRTVFSGISGISDFRRSEPTVPRIQFDAIGIRKGGLSVSGAWVLVYEERYSQLLASKQGYHPAHSLVTKLSLTGMLLARSRHRLT